MQPVTAGDRQRPHLQPVGQGVGGVHLRCCSEGPADKRTDWSPGEWGEKSHSQLRALYRSPMKDGWVDLFVFPKLD